MHKRIMGFILAVSTLLVLMPETAMAARMQGIPLSVEKTKEQAEPEKDAVPEDGTVPEAVPKAQSAGRVSGLEGDGTETSPYRIKDAAQLCAFADLVNGVNGAPDTGICAVLTSNIDLSGVSGADAGSWMPIGTKAAPYAGTFDGGSFAITGLYCHKPNASYVGLFGCNAGTIKNLGVAGADIAGGNYTGGVCGYNNGIITGCYSAASVSGAKYTGGICGYNDGSGTVSVCYNTGAVNGSKYIGGVCGYNKNTTTDCYNMGPIRGDGTSIGGVCGYNRALLSNCFNAGTVSGSGKKYIGSVCGYNHSQSTFSNCYYLITGEEKGNYGTAITQERFASGEICWLLNDGRSENTVWRQTCGTGFPAFGGQAVYQVQRQKADGSAGEMIAAYSNAEKKKQAVIVADSTSEENTHGHIYQEPEWEWQEYKAAKAVFTCLDCGEKQTLEAAVSKSERAATCTSAEGTVYRASVERDGVTYVDKKVKKTGEKLSHEMEPIEAAEATCEETGIRAGYYSCTRCNKYFADEEGKNEIPKSKVVIPATGHDYNADESSWNWNTTSRPVTAIVTLTCKNDGCVKEKEIAGTVTAKTTATCDVQGEIIYTAVATFNKQIFRSETSVSGQTIPHSYEEPKWEWAPDYTKATATVTCAKCSHSETKTDLSPTAERTEPRCIKEGKITHRATVTIDGGEYKSVKTETLSKISHQYGDPTWKWDGYTKATATFTCTDCKKEKVSQKATVDVVEQSDKTIYRASVRFDGTTHIAEKFKEKRIAAEHTLTYVPEAAAACETQGLQEHWRCDECGKLFADGEGQEPVAEADLIIPATGHSPEVVTNSSESFGQLECAVCHKDLSDMPDVKPFSQEEGVDDTQGGQEGSPADGNPDEEESGGEEVLPPDQAEKPDDSAQPPAEGAKNQEDQDEANDAAPGSGTDEAGEESVQDESGIPEVQSESLINMPDVSEDTEQYGLRFLEGKAEKSGSVTADAREGSTVNLQVDTVANVGIQTVQEQQQGYPVWVFVAALPVLAGVLLLLFRKGKRDGNDGIF